MPRIRRESALADSFKNIQWKHPITEEVICVEKVIDRVYICRVMESPRSPERVGYRTHIFKPEFLAYSVRSETCQTQ